MYCCCTQAISLFETLGVGQRHAVSRRQQEEERWVVVRGGALAAEREIVREERNGAAALPMEFCRRGL